MDSRSTLPPGDDVEKQGGKGSKEQTPVCELDGVFSFENAVTFDQDDCGHYFDFDPQDDDTHSSMLLNTEPEEMRVACVSSDLTTVKACTRNSGLRYLTTNESTKACLELVVSVKLSSETMLS